MSSTECHLRGPALLATAVNRILAHPETWDQRHWHCGTTHCVAGHCQIIGLGHENESAGSEARELLGISASDANWLFDARRTLPEIHGFAAALLDGDAGYDRAGYNRDGKALEPLVIPAELLS